MDPLERFGAYAAAFESFYDSDDLAILEPFFTEDAVYEISGGPPFAGRHQGRDAVLAYLKRSVDGFDRRFASRELELLGGPELRKGAVWLRWRANYRSPGLPELSIDGEETVEFEGDRIRVLRDDFALQASAIVAHWFDHYGGELAGTP